MALKELYVRVNLKTKSQKFFRCGVQFTREWKLLTEVADVTAKRLREEQMLEVSVERPADYVEPVVAAPAAPAAPVDPVAPTDPALRAAAIKEAIGKMDVANVDLWTATGMPKLPAIVALTGFEVTQAERDAVWNEIKV